MSGPRGSEFQGILLGGKIIATGSWLLVQCRRRYVREERMHGNKCALASYTWQFGGL